MGGKRDRSLVLLLLTLSGLMGMLALSSSVEAMGATTCSAITGRASTPTARLAGCTVSTTGGGGTLGGSNGIDVVTWKNGGTTTIHLSNHGGTKDHCPSGSSEFYLNGTVTGSTGAAAGIAGSVRAELCITGTKKETVSLLTGTVFKF